MSRTVSILIGLAIVLATLGCAWFLGRWTLAWILGQQSEVAAAFIATAGTVVAGVVAVVFSQQRSKSREIAEAHRPMKVKVYQHFIESTIGILHKYAGAENNNPDAMAADGEVVGFFRKFTTELLLWGSPGVISSWSRFQATSQLDGRQGLLSFDEMIREIREDLGHTNAGLRSGDLVKLLLSDPEKLDTTQAS